MPLANQSLSDEVLRFDSNLIVYCFEKISFIWSFDDATVIMLKRKKSFDLAQIETLFRRLC